MKSLSAQIISDGKFSGIFPGWGESRVVAVRHESSGGMTVVGDTAKYESENPSSTPVSHCDSHAPGDGLSTAFSVSIAGCDLMGSCLYTAGVCAFNSGKVAPVSLLLVTIMLFSFRKVYSEAVTAMPVNGGTYNVVLNTTSKKMASFVACLSVLSYTATAIVSAFDAVVYLNLLWPGANIRVITIAILAGFAGIVLLGVGESAMVTLPMFVGHVLVISVLIIWCFAYGIQDDFQIFHDNMHSPFPDVVSTSDQVLAKKSALGALFFGYSSALLGITGFETASNYVEEMKSAAVFRSTINWMWVLVGVYNPLLSLVSMMVLPMNEIYAHPSDMLAVMADEVGGKAFRTVLCVDAVIILCGGCLTAYVGVAGLLNRLALDNVLPVVMSLKNRRDSPYVSVIVFGLLSISLFVAIFDPTDPTAINNFGGVFAISFISVLIAFASVTILLKLYRPRLARQVIAKWWEVFFSLIAVTLGLAGNIALTPEVFVLFLAYLSGFVAVVVAMFMRVEILSFGIWLVRMGHLSSDKRKETRAMNLEILEASEMQLNYQPFEAVNGVEDDEFMQFGSPRKRPSVEGNVIPGGSPQKKPPSADDRMSVFAWGDGIIETVKRRLSSVSLFGSGPNNIRGVDQDVTDELEAVLQRPISGRLMSYLMSSLDEIVGTPFVYLAKRSDPINLHAAVEYISANESTNNIFVVHFVDDRHAIGVHHKIMRRVNAEVREGKITVEQAAVYSASLWKQIFQTGSPNAAAAPQASPVGSKDMSLLHSLKSVSHEIQQLVKTVALMDTFFTFKKISCVVVRGSYFCPEAVNCIADYLKTTKNKMIMGVPDTKFPFPFAKLKGVRIAVPNSEKSVREGTCAHLHSLFLQDLESQSCLLEANEENQEKEEDREESREEGREGESEREVALEAGEEGEAEEVNFLKSINFHDMAMSRDTLENHVELTFLQHGCADI